MILLCVNSESSVPAAVKIKKTLRNQTVTETQDAVFTLELTHSDVKGSQWIRNGVELQSNDKYEISSDGMVHTLRIKNCNTQDESVYSFKLGKLSANARLNIESQYHLFRKMILYRDHIHLREYHMWNIYLS